MRRKLEEKFSMMMIMMMSGAVGDDAGAGNLTDDRLTVMDYSPTLLVHEKK